MELVEHPRRPVRLMDGQLEPWPESGQSDCIVWFSVPDAVEGGGGPEAEALPAIRLDGDRARLTSIPFFPYHLGLADEVQVKEHQGALYGEQVIRAAPELTVRLFNEASAITLEDALFDPESDEPFWRIVKAISIHGCWFERYTTSYAAFAVDPKEWEYIKPFLELKERIEGLQWELATPLRSAPASF